MHIYLAAPMAGVDFGNGPAIKAATRSLRHRGHDVTSPVEMNDADGEKGAVAIGHPRRAEFMLRDLERIAQADAVVVLPGWETSTGALAEVAFARSIGRPVLRYKGLEPVDEPEAPTSPRHPSSERFHAHLRDLGALHDQKQKDYGTPEDPFANVRGATEWGIPAWEGGMVRANDKMKRLQTYARTGTLANEGVIDAFLDLAIYAIIGLVLFEEDAAERTDPSAT